MTTRLPWKSCVFALLLSGCQSVDQYLPWQASSNDTLTEEELAALHNPQPAAAAPELASDLQPGNPSHVQTVSASSSSTPVAAGRIEQLVRAGQAAIRDGRQGQPAKLQEAKQRFQQVLSEDPENASAHHGLAIVADLENDWPAAERHYKLALQQRSHDPSLLNDLGYSYILQNRFHEASKYLTQAIQISPQHELAHINLALLSLKRGDRSGAEARLASIYTASEINRTLARLEEDLQQQPNITPGTTPPEMQQPQVWGPVVQQSAAYPVGPSASQQHVNPNYYPGANGSAAPQVAAQQVQPPLQPNPWQNQAPNQLPQAGNLNSGAVAGMNGQVAAPAVAQQTGPQAPNGQFAPAAAARPSVQKPISIYPPGVQPAPAESEAATTVAGYPGGGVPVNTATQSSMTRSNGVSVGGVIATPAAASSRNFGAGVAGPSHYQGYPVPAAPQSVGPQSASYPNGQPVYGATAQPGLQSANSQSGTLQAPVQGLNAGPGALFPVTVPNSAPSPNGLNGVSTPASGIPHGASPQPSGNHPYYGTPGVPPQVNYSAGQNNGYAPSVTPVAARQMTPAAATGTVQAPNPNYGGMQRMQNYHQQIQQQHNAPLNQNLQQYAGQRTMPLHQ